MLSGRYVVVQIDGAGQKTQLGLKEVKAFGHLANGKKKQFFFNLPLRIHNVHFGPVLKKIV